MAGPDWIAGDPAALRDWRAAQPEVLHPVLPEGMSVARAPSSLPGGLLCTPARIERDGLILHFHGGGFVVGSPRTHRVVGAWIAEAFGMPVLLAEYPLAPEAVLPVQAEAAAEALHKAADLEPVILSGDSAGAYLAMLAFNWAGAPEGVEGLLALYGVFGARRDSPDAVGDESGGLGQRSVAAMYDRVDPAGLIGSDTRLTPLDPGFRLPGRTVLVAAGRDPVKDETLALHAGRTGEVSLIVAEQMEHGFLSVPRPAPEALAVLRQARRLLLVNDPG